MTCAPCRPDAGDLIEASHRRQQRGLGAPSCQVGVYGDRAAVGAVAVAGFGGLRVGHGGQQLFDAGGEGGDLRGEGVDLIEQHPREFGVVVVEPAGQRLDQGGPLDLHPAARQIGEPTRVAFPGDQRLEHVPHRQRVQRRRHRRHLDQRVLEQLLQPLPVAGAFAGQIDPQPGVVAQLPDRRGRHERLGRSSPFSVSLASQTASSLSVFDRPGHVLHVAGVDQLHRQPRRFEQVVPDPPVVRCRFHGDPLDPGPPCSWSASSVIAPVRRRHVPHPAGPSPAASSGAPHTHLARRLGHIDRGDPLDDQLVLGVGNLLRLQTCLLPHLSCPPNTFTLDRSGRLGASVKGTEILTGVLEATVRDPSRSGPGARLKCGLTHPRKRRRRQATRPHFHACEASPGGIGGSNVVSRNGCTYRNVPHGTYFAGYGLVTPI